MRAYVVHDQDGNVVGTVRSHDDEAPPVVSGDEGRTVVAFEDAGDEFFAEAGGDEEAAVARSRELRVEDGRVVR